MSWVSLTNKASPCKKPQLLLRERAKRGEDEVMTIGFQIKDPSAFQSRPHVPPCPIGQKPSLHLMPSPSILW